MQEGTASFSSKLNLLAKTHDKPSRALNIDTICCIERRHRWRRLASLNRSGNLPNNWHRDRARAPPIAVASFADWLSDQESSQRAVSIKGDISIEVSLVCPSIDSHWMMPFNGDISNRPPGIAPNRLTLRAHQLIPSGRQESTDWPSPLHNCNPHLCLLTFYSSSVLSDTNFAKASHHCSND